MFSNKHLALYCWSPLQTDVAGGYHPSVLDAIRTAVSVSKSVGFGKGNDHTAISHHEAFYMATLGGAKGVC